MDKQFLRELFNGTPVEYTRTNPVQGEITYLFKIGDHDVEINFFAFDDENVDDSLGKDQHQKIKWHNYFEVDGSMDEQFREDRFTPEHSSSFWATMKKIYIEFFNTYNPLEVAWEGATFRHDEFYSKLISKIVSYLNGYTYKIFKGDPVIFMIYKEGHTPTDLQNDQGEDNEED